MSYSEINIVHEYSIDGSVYIDHGFVVFKDSSGISRVPLNDLRGFKGEKSIDELESLSGMTENDTYAVTDSGTLVNADGSALVITHGDLVQYDGSKWVSLIRLTNYVSFEKFKDAVEMLTAAIASAFAAEHAYTREHIEETWESDNPHNIKGVYDFASGKATKVANATENNFAALDANGDLKDSGKTASDFATSEQGTKADSAIQGVSVNGAALTPDSNNAVDVSVPTSSNATPLMDGTAAAGVGTQWARGDHRHPTDTSREAVANKKQSINDSSTTDYPSSKAVADFVNSSVATNTANFLGNFSLADLGLTYPATNVQIASALNSHTWPTGVSVTNNDYVYVEIKNPQTTGVDDAVERYKYSEVLESWGYEYTLNNSSFTAAEIAAIDSGITATDKGNYDAHLANTDNPHQVTAAQVGAEPAFSVLPISKGGTGKTTGKAATNNLFSDINTVNTDPDDTAKIVFKYGSPSDSNGIFFARSITNLWNYIKSNINSVLGLSENGYTGNAATASAAAIGSALETAINAKMGNTDDASNTTTTFTKASGDTSTMASGGKLSAIFTAISSIFASLKALAFKDKVSDSDINGTISDSHIESASTWNGKQDSLGINTSSGDTGKFLNERGAFATPSYPSVPSVINNLTSTSTTDALSAAQGKELNDNKQANLPTSGTPTDTYAVNVSGTAAHLSTYGEWNTLGVNSYDATNPYAVIGEQRWALTSDNGEGSLLQFEFLNSTVVKIKLWVVTSGTSVVKTDAIVIESTANLSFVKERINITYFTFTSSGTQYIAIRLYVKFTNNGQYWRVRQLDCQTGNQGSENWRSFDLRTGSGTSSSSAVGTPFTYSFARPFASGQVGSTSQPVYVGANGQVQPCDPSQMGVGAASYAEKAKEGCKGNNTATLYIAGTFGEGNIPYYNVKDIKNGCVNYVHVKDIPSNTCSITIEAPTLASGEEYDYVVVFDTFTNSNLVGSIDVENCKKAGRFENNVFVVDSMALTSGNPRYVPMIVVTGNVASSKWYERL